MPQGRRPTAEEVLGIAPRRPSAEEVLGLPPQRPTAEQVLGLTPQQPPQESAYERFKRNVGIEGQRFLRNVGDTAQTASDIVTSAFRGDFRPLAETAEITGRRILQPLAMVAGAPGVTAEQTLAIGDVERRQAVRRERGPNADYWRRSQQDIARLEAEAAKDPSLSGKITRGVAGVALSFAEPQNVALGAGLGAIGGGATRAARSVSAIERTLGKGAAQIVEQEAAQAIAPTLRAVAPSVAGQIRASGPAIEEAAIRAASPSQGLNAAISQAASQVPESTARRIASEFSAFPRAMMSSLDISAPGRQGLLLSVAPSRWGAAITAGKRMFQAFKSDSYNRIVGEIVRHADAPLAEKSGLYLALRQSEEFFTSKLASKVPGVSASQRAYETYLDSLRMSTFSQYKRIIDKAGLADPTRAYEAAARWINVATGRGSLGKRFDDAVPFLSQILFAPRFAASRFNVLNPVMYWRNFKDPATRVVGKQQMKDLAQYLSAVAVTFGLAKAAGFDVGLNPDKGDFLKIRAGTKTYDPGAGLVQVMRFAIRAGYDLFRASKGEKADWGKDLGSLALKFIRSKTAPLPSYAWDFFSRQTYEGKKFTPGQAALGVVERTTPLTWSDFTEALYNEGIGSAAATLPGATGIGVQSYTEPNGFIEKAQPLFREYTRAGRQLPEIRRLKDEPDDAFNARIRVFGEALQQYGVGLVESQEYRQADTATKDRALLLLPRRISTALLKQGESWALAPRVIMSDVKENLELRRELQRGR